MAANAGETKVKLWEGICYPENMRDDWQDEIDDIQAGISPNSYLPNREVFSWQ